MQVPVPILTDDERRRAEALNRDSDGFLERFIEWGGKKTDAPKYSLLSAALQALSLAAGDTTVMHNFFGSSHVYLNLYTVVVGPSTIMRKTTVLGFVEDVLPVNQTTGEEYIKFLDDVSIQAFTKTIVDQGKTMSPVLMSVDEVAHLFSSTKKKDSYLANFDKHLLKAYDHTRVSVTRVGGDTQSKTGAFVNLYGVSTPEPLMEALDSGDVASGLLPRLLIFDVRDAERGERKTLAERRAAAEGWEEEKARLRAFLADIAAPRAIGVPSGFLPDGTTQYPVREIPMSDEAQERLDQVDALFSKTAGVEDAAVAALKGRAFWHLMKLSGLFALSRGGATTTLEVEDVLRAAWLVESTIGDVLLMKEEVGTNAIERSLKSITAMLEASPSGRVSVAHVARTLKLTTRDSREVFGTLAMRGLAHIEGDVLVKA